MREPLTSDEEPRGGGGRFYRVDDTEELLGGRDYILTTPDAILYCDGRVYIWARARQYIWARASIYIWARHVNILARHEINAIYMR